jgi:spermidine/putrescine transport system ATP-binding protein
MPAPLIQIKEVTRRFGNATALHSISLDIHSGEFFTLLGPSGCGKTTLLRMIAGFDAPDEGDILLDGKSIVDLPPEQRPIHTVFQSYALFPHLTVAENIAFPLKMAKKEGSFIQQRIKESLELIHLEDKGEQYPHQLSGGQCQRVALN